MPKSVTILSPSAYQALLHAVTGNEREELNHHAESMETCRGRVQVTRYTRDAWGTKRLTFGKK